MLPALAGGLRDGGRFDVTAGSLADAAAAQAGAAGTEVVAVFYSRALGLVVRGAPSAQIRFAGLTPDEEGKIREWVKSGAQQQPAAAPASPPRPAAPSPSPQRPPATPAQVTPAPQRSTSTPQPDSTPVRSPPAAQPSMGARAAPAAGPPPGFMDRKPP